MELLKLGFSSCPNDTFMFDAWVNGRIDAKLPKAEIQIKDIEELNSDVLNGLPDVCKISFAVYPEISKEYQLLSAGSALGYKNGPLLVSRNKIYPDELADVKIAIPGVKTTANFLLSILFPEAKNKQPYLFSEIMEVVMDHEMDAGLIIHESRFRYIEKGLKLIEDLGESWESKYNLPIPLGGIAVKRHLDQELKQKINSCIHESISFAFKNPSMGMPWIREHAQELSDEVIHKHIELYVNDFSLDLGSKGREAIEFLISEGSKAGLFDPAEEDIFAIHERK